MTCKMLMLLMMISWKSLVQRNLLEFPICVTMECLMDMQALKQLSLQQNTCTRTLYSSFQKVDGEAANKDREIKRCLTDAYKKTDDEFLLEASKASPVWKDGSTAVTALVMDDVLYVANLGDSRALLCRCGENGETSVVSLSKDHSPSQYEERMRIQKAGGTVREGRVLGVLEVSRSIGDGRFKRCGVSCIPDVMRCTLTDNDRFLLLACDGLWKGFSVDSALKFINDILEKENFEETETIINNTGLEDVQLDPVSARFQEACHKIASEAIRNGSSDNVTVMLVSVTKQ
ncbi:Integrin-linked kinase-associated serine/threonine phosphatase 2C [Stylophora pistillata]|uniref:Integrin-linked kinase-associated serine/threonine phosphatase 2C n=1 Tax=Stylophora pistillata TaxID=50429 RepID=A0A2B4RSZ0_STYPI|nr:Integrin-linked kinase-associated serine/threonine phosphatase 2C [Stylophora pistillata]